MPSTLHDKIRRILETTPGLTQRGLASRMGLNPAAVNRMLYGQRNIMADEIPVIENYLGVALDVHAPAAALEYRQEKKSFARRGLSDVAPSPLQDMPSPAMALIPVYGGQRGSDIIDWIARHPAQGGSKDAYAIYMSADDMSPRYLKGEILYIHPHRPQEAGKDIVVEMKDGTVLVRRLIAQTDSQITVHQFNPEKDTKIPRKDIRAIYTIVGRG